MTFLSVIIKIFNSFFRHVFIKNKIYSYSALGKENQCGSQANMFCVK